ncbi:hypothetical protein ACH41H_36165 [Streptomyces sp. NPDC020800]|uniref:hypothetical protein n=1 Tax=Streptomyces sp. NPDC020800 TaxID=3365092 RepID=UPI0037A1C377
MSTRTLDYRGRIVESGWLAKASRDQLRELAEQFPAGMRVRHSCGREGTVAVDQPVHVPGVFGGQPTTVCLSRGRLQPMVFAHWDNEAELIWGVWVPVSAIRAGRTLAVNRSGNRAKAGARR